MGIKQPKQKFKVSNKDLGIAMQSYYGGRAECRIRRTPVPVIHTDFTSQYPTVNALLGNWDVLTSNRIELDVDYRAKARSLLSKAELNGAFGKDFWKQLSFFALVKPKDDILPVRTVYDNKGNKRTQNIGLNYLRSNTPIWYAGPDLNCEQDPYWKGSQNSQSHSPDSWQSTKKPESHKSRWNG